MTHLSIVIPVYNESSLIDELVKKVKTNIKLISENYEIIIVDDGSQDNTWDLIENEAKSENRIKGIKLSKNFGHHYAITAGIHNSIGEWVVVMDGDLQDRPEVIPDLYKKANEGFDVVFVSRQNRPEKLYYRIAQKIFYKILRVMSGLDYNSKQANFSIIHRRVANAFNKFSEKDRFYGSIVKLLGFRVAEVRADHGRRFAGRPSYTLKKRIKLAIDIIIGLSDKPLKFATRCAFIAALLSTFYLFTIFGVLSKTNYSIPSNMHLTALILFLTCILSFVLGVIGVYIGRIYFEVKKRPLYIISELINIKNEKIF